jgi:DNA-directed RNA polymerase omega subunit
VNNDKMNLAIDKLGNRYLLVLAAAKRSRQLLDRAEKHGMSADSEKVILQSLEEVISGKVVLDRMPYSGPKKKSKD